VKGAIGSNIEHYQVRSLNRPELTNEDKVSCFGNNRSLKLGSTSQLINF